MLVTQTLVSVLQRPAFQVPLRLLISLRPGALIISGWGPRRISAFVIMCWALRMQRLFRKRRPPLGILWLLGRATGQCVLQARSRVLILTRACWQHLIRPAGLLIHLPTTVCTQSLPYCVMNYRVVLAVGTLGSTFLVHIMTPSSFPTRVWSAPLISALLCYLIADA